MPARRKPATQEVAVSPLKPSNHAPRKRATVEEESAPPTKPAKRTKAAVPAAAASSAKPQLSFVVREVYKKEWSSWGERGVSARRQLVGVYSSALDANRAAVHRFYQSAAELDFPDLDDGDACEVIFQRTGKHMVFQMEVSHGDESPHSLTVRVTEHAMDGDTSPWTQAGYREKLRRLEEGAKPTDGGKRKRPVDNDEEDDTRRVLK